MSGKGNKIEEEEEETKVVHHWSHEHRLTLEKPRIGEGCFGCGKPFNGGEKAYACRCWSVGKGIVLDEECLGMPRKIRHAMHPQHILTQHVLSFKEYENGTLTGKLCAICESSLINRVRMLTRRDYFLVERFLINAAGNIFYKCMKAECELWMHMRCAQGSDMMYDAADDDDDEQCRTINHRSHPKHGLKLVRRSSPFKCDACGITRGGESYICCKPNCQYWIHKSCASLPQTIESEYHSHSLSLSFHVPPQYMKRVLKCDVCSKYLPSKYWIYHCEPCSYVVHLNCASNATRNEKGIMEFPISDVGEELIGGLVKREGGAISIPHHDEDYKFHNHKLILVSSSLEEKEENSSDDDDGKDQESQLICDGCITPIFNRKQRPSSSSSSSSSSKDYYYMSCSSGCNYNLHMACFHLPSRVPSIPLHHQSGHHLILKSSDKLPAEEWECKVCDLYSSGLFYACTKCNFRADIKCASLPAAIYHTAHPQHPLHFQSGGGQVNCHAMCGDYIYSSNCYACGSCEFIVHVRCAVLAASITSRRWDKHHPLLLTYDANLNHQGESIYCDACERAKMNPKAWMYRCRHCDLSIHPRCLKSTSGKYRNIKLGKEYVIHDAALHPPHPLAYQLLPKRRCDLCHLDKYKERGFECASCNFCVCLCFCGEKMLRYGNMRAVQ
ncbi:uncharacterized protein LOC131015342 isoform X2 [Salvia miltiorrhiza]|uniref:uncharacterized protein LOC131015342 isoform X2 n=1 Tax=Salvia miltiorrhiza TaxID=226208 RepID=UPI0025ACB10D|nr:uncharacterized protein LOC131015342 isoform X2 [Salvia miltiorrhiza]